MIKKLIGTIALSLTCAVSFAAGGGYKLDQAPNRINDMAAQAVRQLLHGLP